MKSSTTLTPAYTERALLALQKASEKKEPCFVVFGFGLPPTVVNDAKKLIDREFLKRGEESK